MKFLILGASGMAGHVICIYLREQGHNVTGFSRKKVNFVESISGDVNDLEYLRGIIETGHFDAVINAVGILNQAAEENKASAVFLNGYLPHFLAKITEDIKTQIIHMSTDCVFSCKSVSEYLNFAQSKNLSNCGVMPTICGCCEKCADGTGSVLPQIKMKFNPVVLLIRFWANVLSPITVLRFICITVPPGFINVAR